MHSEEHVVWRVEFAIMWQVESSRLVKVAQKSSPNLFSYCKVDGVIKHLLSNVIDPKSVAVLN